MPRTHKRQLGSRCYRNYSEESLHNAIEEITSKKLSLRKASEKYGIHRNTLWLKIKGLNTGNVGKPPVFNEEEENQFAAHCIAMSSYGFPVSSFDLRCVVRSYLERCGRKVDQFRNNFPGKEWARSFLNRHKILTQRTAKNISIARAGVDQEVIDNFFCHLKREIDGVPATHIFNYDETNLNDDPGSEKVITKRGVKYPEKIRNATKACTSLMFCGSASGEILPPHVNYKAEQMWSTWTMNGPEGVRYSRTPSGWFDHRIFEDWFINTLLPHLKKLDGKKVVIGDNLSSHINLEVLRLCDKYNIKFIALPPNATHLLQPLDVAYFKPLKTAWRKVLEGWKETAKGSSCTTVPKDTFSTLLKDVLITMQEKTPQYLISGFRKCGICPINSNEVLSRLPKAVTADVSICSNLVGESFLKHLEEKRANVTQRSCTRRKRVNVPPGKSITAMDVLHSVSADGTMIDAPQPSTSGSSSGRQLKRKMCTGSRRSFEVSRRQRKRNTATDTTDSDSCSSESIPYEESGDSSWEFGEEEPLVNANSQPRQSISVINIGDDVIVLYEGAYFPGIVEGLSGKSVMVSAMVRSGCNWKWPTKKDVVAYDFDEVICKINKPKQLSRREIFDVPEMAAYNEFI